jgi:ureidoglycolate lyase
MAVSERVLAPRALDDEAFRPFGRAVKLPQARARKRGIDWDCWFELGSLGACEPSVGIVLTRPTDGRIEQMEREPTSELLLPVTGAVVQAVAPPGDLDDAGAQPDADAVAAFVVEPGEAVIMAPGTWHWAAIPLRGETLYYFVTQAQRLEPGQSPWVPFRAGRTVKIDLTAAP